MLLERETEFEALYRAHYSHVYHYILRRIGDRDTAQELTADVFRIVWNRQDRLEGSAVPWLLGIARNVLGNEYRGRKRRQELQLRLRDFALHQAGQQASGTSDAVIEALGRLASRHREVLILVFWDNLSTPELAEFLGCSDGAASVRIHRAKKAFAKTMPSLHVANLEATRED